MARLADRWSLGFLLVAVTIALAAWWTTSDPVRVVAVLVIATPCPLILAVPVALVAGLSRAAHYGVLVKRAQPLEAMARTQTLVLDKTGTLTDGQPRITGIESAGPLTGDKVLRLAASLDQVSKHPVAQAVVDAAKSPGGGRLQPRRTGMRRRAKALRAPSRDATSGSEGSNTFTPRPRRPAPARRIALQSVVAGIGLSVIGMVAAALGYLEPVEGALLHALIDVAVVLNALRALRNAPQGAEQSPA